MTNKSISSTWATKWASDETAHYNVPIYEWFRSNSLHRSHPSTFTPDLGTTSVDFPSNVSDPTGYDSSIGSQFWATESDLHRGFQVTKPSTPLAKKFNVEISGGSGLWMPCAIFGSFSFYYSNKTNANSNFVPRNIGFRLANVKTNDRKTWGAGWANNHTADATGKVYVLNGASKVNSIRSLGPDWFIYGAIFNFWSNSTAAPQAPVGELVDCRVGWRHDGLSGTNRMILPNRASWDSHRTRHLNGILHYS